MFLTPGYGHMIQRVIEENPDAGLITCVTNRVGAQSQLDDPGVMATDRLLELRALALARWRTYGTAVSRIRVPASGFFFLFRRAVWKLVGGFKGRGLLDVDWQFSRDIEEAGLPLLRMEGLFVVHFHRLDGTFCTHLQNT